MTTTNSKHHESRTNVLKKLGTTLLTAMFVFSFVIYVEPIRVAHATPTPAEISVRITQETGLSPSEIDQIYAAEQAPNVLLIAYDVTIPILLEDRIGYLLIRNAATGEWIRMIVTDTNEWKNDFRPYLEAQGVEIHKQPYGTIDNLTPAAEAAAIAAVSSIPGAAVANLVLNGKISNPFQPSLASDFPDAPIVNPSVPSGDVGPNSVGALNGSGGVSGGQASYSIPIVAPPGRKGMQPSVSLNYSSSAGNRIAGVGWGISGVSTISRCAASAAQDGFTAGVQYSATRDRLCLDGQRLMVVAGTYGASGAEYRTELDIFARITQTGAINSPTSFFKVEYKNGRISWFGNTADSRHSADGRTEVMTWSIADMRDRSGNTITYDYVNEGNGEYNIASIHYTGYNGSDGDRHVRFEYEPRSDVRTFYRAGGKTRSTKRLKTIRTEYQAQIVREYTLTYGVVSQSTERSLLRSVQECAYEGATPHCLPASNFEWQESAPQYAVEQLQFLDPDNLVAGGSNPEIIHADKRWLHEVLPHGDTNGDGVKDWSNWYVNSEGEITDVHANTLANCFRPPNGWNFSCPEGDFNADGRTDSFRKGAGQELEIRFAGTEIWFTTGIDWDATGGQGRGDAPLGFADFDGDGWIDIAIKQDEKLWVYFHTTSLTAPYSTTQRQWLYDYPYISGASNSIDIQIYGDMDGNGTPDFVVSDFPGATLVPGLPRPRKILLTQSQAGGTMSVTERLITNLLETINSSAHFFHDINGDGLQDILALDSWPSNVLHYRINDGTDFVGGWTSLGISLPTRTGYHNIGSGEEEPYAYPTMSKILSMDYDGDGRQELLIADTVLASSCAELAEYDNFGNLQLVWRCDDGLYGTFNSSSASSLVTDAQINSNILDNSIRRYSARKFNEDASGNITITEFATDIIASAAQTAAVDVTGDGLTDVVSVFGCRLTAGCEYNTETSARTGTVQNGSYVEGAWINRNRGTASGNQRYAGYDLMSAVQDGLGNREEWVYRPLSSDEYDTANSDFYETVHADQATDVDYFHFASSMNVVADHRASNGVGGLNSTKYRYRGAIYNNKGRGFQGFKTIIVEEDVYPSGHPLANSDKITRTDFYQKWPLSGQLDKTCTWLASDAAMDDNPSCASSLLLTSTNSFHNVATTGGARFVAVDDQTAQTFDLTSRQLLTTQQTQRSFNIVGSLTSESVHHFDDWTDSTSQSTTVFEMPDFGAWWLSKITSQSRTSNPIATRHGNSPGIATGTDSTKTVTTNFTQYDTTHRAPTSASIVANDTPLTQTITTSYNAYGLPATVSTSGSGVTGPRSVTTTYSSNGATQSSDGYFPFAVRNTLNHETERHTDPKYGQPINQWDANDLLTTTAYDAFGRVSDVTPPGQPTARQRYFWCGIATSCPTGAVFAVKTYRAGASEIQSYLDSLGREIQSSVRNFAGSSFVNVTTSFDARGNTKFVSSPYDLAAGESAAIGTRFLSFDALGRLLGKEIDQANGAVFLTSYTYDGLKTSINAGGLLMHRIYNGLLQLVETKDAMNGFTRYVYDGAGNPIVLAGPNNSSIFAEYNALGHKEWVNDPNMGLKAFTYSALGEVLTELDANGDTVSMDYDVLGRLSERRVNGSLTGSWHYDNSAANKGVGLLDYEDSHPTSDGSGLQKHYTYSPTVSGRKDLTRVSHRFYENSDATTYTAYDTDYYTDSYYARPTGVRYPGGVGVAFVYNSDGFLTKESDAASGYVIRQISARDSRNEMIAGTLANGNLSQIAAFYDATGQAKSIVVTGPSGDVHDLFYAYDTFGNLDYQRTKYAGATSTESFAYDDLHRLTQSNRTLPSGSSTVNYTYDAAGNLTSKDDYASNYEYNPSRPNAVESVTKVDGGGNALFFYDANGNLKSGDGKTLTYNAFNKPIAVTAGGITASFFYGSDLSRYKQTKSTGETVFYIDKLMEIVTSGGSTDYRHYISDAAIVTKTGSLSDSSPSVRFLHRDRLGSLATITDEHGQEAEARGFDPFGKPRDGDWADRSPATLSSTITDRGFTEHEHLDESQLIHMNGRAYDYNLGRFLSVDPIIQAPGNSQSLNPYSYILNNPLSGVDPSGYCSGTRIKSENGSICGSGAGGIESDVVKAVVTRDEAAKLTFIHVEGGNGAQREAYADAIRDHLAANGFGGVDQIGGLTDRGRVNLDPGRDAPGQYERIFNSAVAAAPQAFAGAAPGGDATYELVVNQDIEAAAQSAGLELGMTAGGAAIGTWFGGVGAVPGAALGYIGAKTIRFGRAIGRLFGKRGSGRNSGDDYLYRGVHSDHPEFEAASSGRVVPGNPNGNVTPAQHNRGGDDVLADSPFTSWTTDIDVARGRAGADGVLLRVPTGRPPTGAKWNWEWSPDVFSESEVLLRGAREGCDVIKCGK